MNFSKTLSFALIGLTSLALSATEASARNPARYTGVPFVVGGWCPGSSTNYVSQNGKLVLELVQPDPPGAGNGGWEVFSSFPGVNPGNTTPTATTSAPTGTYGFYVSGLTGSGNTVEVVSVDAMGNGNYVVIPITNGQVFVTSPPPKDSGSPIVAVNFWIFNGTVITNTLIVSNLTINNVPIPFDTTHFDAGNDSIEFSWCNEYELRAPITYCN